MILAFGISSSKVIFILQAEVIVFYIGLTMV